MQGALNQVEIELSVLSRQCLERRIPEVQILKSVHSRLEETAIGKNGQVLTGALKRRMHGINLNDYILLFNESKVSLVDY